MDVRDSDVMGQNLPDELSPSDGGTLGKISFHDGEARPLSGEHLLSDGRVATMTRLVHCTPKVGSPGQYSAVRYYRHQNLQGEMYLHAEDLMRIAQRYDGSATISDPSFPGELTAERSGQIIRLRKRIDAGVLSSVLGATLNGQDDALVSEVELTKSEMTQFARSVMQVRK